MSDHSLQDLEFLLELRDARGRIDARMNEKHQVDFEVVQKSMDFFLGLNTHFGVFAIPEIWPDQVEHFTRKFNDFYYRPNSWDLFKFYNSLDCMNQRKLVIWYNRKMVDETARLEKISNEGF